MTGTSIVFLVIGATVLWGGFALSLRNLLKYEKNEVDLKKEAA